MKVGSLVECIRPFGSIPEPWEKYPTVGVVYTVRSIEKDCGGAFIRLEEIINPIALYREGYQEIRFFIDGFREIEFDEDEIKEVISQTSLIPQLQ